MHFNVHTETVAGAPSVSTTALPNYGQSLIGNAVYTHIAGKPAIYANGGPASAAKVTLRNIAVTNVAGDAVSGYSLLSADAEATASDEEIDWTSDQPIDLVAALPGTGAGLQNGCQDTATGLGTTAVQCSGARAPGPGQTYGSLVVKSNGVKTFTATATSPDAASGKATRAISVRGRAPKPGGVTG